MYLCACNMHCTPFRLLTVNCFANRLWPITIVIVHDSGTGSVFQTFLSHKQHYHCESINIIHHKIRAWFKHEPIYPNWVKESETAMNSWDMRIIPETLFWNFFYAPPLEISKIISTILSITFKQFAIKYWNSSTLKIWKRSEPLSRFVFKGECPEIMYIQYLRSANAVGFNFVLQQNPMRARTPCFLSLSSVMYRLYSICERYWPDTS